MANVQGCHEALIEWVERHEHIAVSQQCVVIMLQVSLLSLMHLLIEWVERHEHIAVSQQCVVIMLQVSLLSLMHLLISFHILTVQSSYCSRVRYIAMTSRPSVCLSGCNVEMLWLYSLG